MSNELSVLVDVRVSPDSPELVLVRQALAVVDGELRLVGGRAESRVALIAQRVAMEARLAVESGSGSALAVEVRNAGSVPVRVSSVTFLCQGLLTLGGQSPPPEQPAGALWSTQLAPKDAARSKVLYPGEVRDWYLPLDSWLSQLDTVTTLPPDKYKVVIHSGKEPIAELLGGQLKPLFDRYTADTELHMGSALRSIVATLPRETHERIDAELKSILATPFEQWDR